MTHGQLTVVLRALAHLIKQTPPPKTAAAKKERTTLLQDILNAARSRAAEPDPLAFPPAPRGGAATGAAPPAGVAPNLQPDEPTTLRVDIVAPQAAANVPTVRAGSVGGVPDFGIGDEFRDAGEDG
jgi:hypothetical protein